MIRRNHMLTDQQLQTLLELEARAAKGNLYIDRDIRLDGAHQLCLVGTSHTVAFCSIGPTHEDWQDANADKLAAGWNHLRELVEEVRRLRTLREKVRAYKEAWNAAYTPPRLSAADLLAVQLAEARKALFALLAATEGEA